MQNPLKQLLLASLISFAVLLPDSGTLQPSGTLNGCWASDHRGEWATYIGQFIKRREDQERVGISDYITLVEFLDKIESGQADPKSPKNSALNVWAKKIALAEIESTKLVNQSVLGNGLAAEIQRQRLAYGRLCCMFELIKSKPGFSKELLQELVACKARAKKMLMQSLSWRNWFAYMQDRHGKNIGQTIWTIFISSALVGVYVLAWVSRKEYKDTIKPAIVGLETVISKADIKLFGTPARPATNSAPAVEAVPGAVDKAEEAFEALAKTLAPSAAAAQQTMAVGRSAAQAAKTVGSGVASAVLATGRVAVRTAQATAHAVMHPVEAATKTKAAFSRGLREAMESCIVEHTPLATGSFDGDAENGGLDGTVLSDEDEQSADAASDDLPTTENSPPPATREGVTESVATALSSARDGVAAVARRASGVVTSAITAYSEGVRANEQHAENSRQEALESVKSGAAAAYGKMAEVAGSGISAVRAGLAPVSEQGGAAPSAEPSSSRRWWPSWRWGRQAQPVAEPDTADVSTDDTSSSDASSDDSAATRVDSGGGPAEPA